MTPRAADLHKHRVTCAFAYVSATFKSRHSPHADLRVSSNGPGRVRKSYTVRAVVTLLAALATFAVASPSTAQQGPVRWDKPVLTVHVADAAAWAGTDVQAALDEWAPAFRMTLTDSPDADVTLEVGNADDALGGDSVAATATKATDGSVITHCRVGLDVDRASTDVGPLLAHELGHCLGLGHRSGAEGGSVMHWFAQDFQGGWSDTVTAADINRVKEMYR